MDRRGRGERKTPVGSNDGVMSPETPSTSYRSRSPIATRSQTRAPEQPMEISSAEGDTGGGGGIQGYNVGMIKNTFVPAQNGFYVRSSRKWLFGEPDIDAPYKAFSVTQNHMKVSYVQTDFYYIDENNLFGLLNMNQIQSLLQLYNKWRPKTRTVTIENIDIKVAQQIGSSKVVSPYPGGSLQIVEAHADQIPWKMFGFKTKGANRVTSYPRQPWGVHTPLKYGYAETINHPDTDPLRENDKFKPFYDVFQIGAKLYTSANKYQHHHVFDEGTWTSMEHIAESVMDDPSITPANGTEWNTSITTTFSRLYNPILSVGTGIRLKYPNSDIVNARLGTGPGESRATQIAGHFTGDINLMAGDVTYSHDDNKYPGQQTNTVRQKNAILARNLVDNSIYVPKPHNAKVDISANSGSVVDNVPPMTLIRVNPVVDDKGSDLNITGTADITYEYFFEAVPKNHVTTNVNPHRYVTFDAVNLLEWDIPSTSTAGNIKMRNGTASTIGLFPDGATMCYNNPQQLYQ